MPTKRTEQSSCLVTNHRVIYSTTGNNSSFLLLLYLVTLGIQNTYHKLVEKSQLSHL